MNVLFLTMAQVDVNQRSIYNDLMRKFKKEGHTLYIVCPTERREGKKTHMEQENGISTQSK